MARNVMVDPRLVPGGGATEMALAHALNEKAKSVAGVQQWPYRAVSRALEVIPRTLLQNCGASTIRVLTALRVGWLPPPPLSPSSSSLPLQPSPPSLSSLFLPPSPAYSSFCLFSSLSLSPSLIPLLILSFSLSPSPSLSPLSQAKHAVEGNSTWGVDGDRGVLADMKELGVWEPLSVKVQTFKTAIEVYRLEGLHPSTP